MRGLRAWTAPGAGGNGAAGASLGCPGQEGFQVRSGGRGAAGLGAGGQVVLEQGEGFQVVPGGGGGDGPDVGGQVCGPPGAGAVEVLAADHGVAQRALRDIIIQRQLRQVLVAGKAVPFAGQGGDDPGGGRVQQAVCGQSGLLDAGGVQAGEGPLVALERLLVRAGAGNGRGQGVVGPVQDGDPLCPRRAPLSQLVRVGGAGPQEVPADMGIMENSP